MVPVENCRAVVQVDARRLLCPMPVIRLQQALAGLPPGALVEVVCSDPGALQDVPAWCRIHGHVLLEAVVQSDQEIHIRVEVGARAP
ncbi:MAG TPA: sulfurtransferase TusA family protein [Acidiferrobacteraceae bacterium]|nr:sulfurtransferase TusA family protein [Acidiferrobacteraceae bacterium]